MPEPTSPATGDRRWSFERDVDGYMAGRPPYPDRVYALLAELGVLGEGKRLLELGPGTGQATAVLLDHGVEVDAIEMGAHLAERLRANLPDARLRITVGDVHRLPLPSAAYDGVVAATMFHWLDVPSLLPGLAAALKPGGWLVVWWHVFGDPDVTTPFRQRVDAIFRELLPSEHVPADELPRAVRVQERLDELTDGGWFTHPRHEILRWNARMDAERVKALFATFPSISRQEPALRDEMLTRLGEAVEAEGGVVDDPMLTAVYAVQVAAR